MAIFPGTQQDAVHGHGAREALDAGCRDRGHELATLRRDLTGCQVEGGLHAYLPALLRHSQSFHTRQVCRSLESWIGTDCSHANFKLSKLALS